LFFLTFDETDISLLQNALEYYDTPYSWDDPSGLVSVTTNIAPEDPKVSALKRKLQSCDWSAQELNLDELHTMYRVVKYSRDDANGLIDSMPLDDPDRATVLEEQKLLNALLRRLRRELLAAGIEL